MTATQSQYSDRRPALYLAFELGWSQWKLAFATAPADAPRLRSIGARNTQAVLLEIAKAKKRFALPDDAPVYACYEAGRDGFWLHERARTIRTATTEPLKKVQKLLNLRGIGANSAWLYVMEFFGWRQLRNRKQVAALAGLTPTPYDSGDSRREQGISKAGNRRLRTMAVEIAWSWLHYQPDSALSRWYVQRWGSGNSRQRRIGIVALARKLLVALWRYLETDQVSEGAVTLEWKVKMAGLKRRDEACA